MTRAEELYRSMLRIRRVEEAIAARYAAQDMRCPVHLSIGQEAVAAGICAALNRSDGVFSGHRSHAHYLAKGGNLVAMIAEIYGLAGGCCNGVGGSMHMIDLDAGFLGAVPLVGATVPVAVGAAWAARLRGEDRVIAVFFGDGTFEEGVIHESVNFAVLHRLPALFVCENNAYSCYTRIADRQPNRPIHAIAAAHGCASAALDGNDAEAVFEAARVAVADLRNGGAPAFLECATYRWLEHCGPNLDDNLGYRPAGELQQWQSACPLVKLAAKLSATVTGRSFLDAAEREIAKEVSAAFSLALESGPPASDDLASYLYG